MKELGKVLKVMDRDEMRQTPGGQDMIAKVGPDPNEINALVNLVGGAVYTDHGGPKIWVGPGLMIGTDMS